MATPWRIVARTPRSNDDLRSAAAVYMSPLRRFGRLAGDGATVTSPVLSVVIPTRNRPESVLRLLRSLSAQTLPRQDYEVIVVDDGSQPPLEYATFQDCGLSDFTIVRRDSNHGAHASRSAGLDRASAPRVLFLDDDVSLSDILLSEHARVERQFAVGQILYDVGARETPYFRYQTKRYEFADSALQEQEAILAAVIYICNASGVTERFRTLFDGVARLLGSSHAAGDGFDEELLNMQMKHSSELAVYLRKAVALHIDMKSLDDARRERRARGETECRLLLRLPEVRADFRSYETLVARPVSLRAWKPRLYWAAPSLFGALSDACTLLADRAPARFVPSWICYPALAISFWEGMRQVAPSYPRLRAALLSPGEPQ